MIEDKFAEQFVNELKEEGHSLEDIYVCIRVNEVRFTEEFIQKHSRLNKFFEYGPTSSSTGRHSGMGPP